jgi:hypothetical protein
MIQIIFERYLTMLHCHALLYLLSHCSELLFVAINAINARDVYSIIMTAWSCTL